MTNAITINPPPYVTSMDEMFWGVILVAASLMMHGMGMLGTLRVSDAYKRRFQNSTSFIIGIIHLILASWMITLAHVLEVMMWAGFFQWKHCFVNYSTAAYFALNEYTTVGSEFNLPTNWRLLEGMIATAGLLGFAWSTAVLLTLAQNFQERRMQFLEQKSHQKHPASKA
jgi:voltage-gated potassium channel